MQKLVGRGAELTKLLQHVKDAERGAGGLILVCGDAGVGKSSLVSSALADAGLSVVFSSANPLATPPLGPVADALRTLRAETPSEFAVALGRSPALLRLLPELGTPTEPADRIALLSAICAVLRDISRSQPLLLVLDDLQWADHATLELLPMLAEMSRDAALLIIGIYSADAMGGAHPLRAVREALRRARRLIEIPLVPLNEEEVRVLAEQCAGAPLDAVTIRRLLAATGGMPFFVESLARLLLADDQQALESRERLRDAVLVRFDRLTAKARLAAEGGAVFGTQFALDHVARLAGDDQGLGELLTSGLVVEHTRGTATFRPALIREPLYEAIPWTRRRSMHRSAADILEAEGQVHAAAKHWREAGESLSARRALLAAAEQARALHAHRDRAAALQEALDRWSSGDDEAQRLNALDQFGDASLLSGKGTDAIKAWREVTDSTSPHAVARARALRKIANVHEMNCDWTGALAARQDAQSVFATAGEHAEATMEGITTALRLRQLARHAVGLQVLERATADAQRSGRKDLQVRVAALKANLEVRLGKVNEGIPAIRAALEAALALDLPVLAGEVYQRLADAIERSGDYQYATKVNLEGITFCEQRKAPPGILACLACMSWILIRCGEWENAESASRRMADDFGSNPVGRAVGIGHLGLVHVLRGELRKAEPLLMEADVLARQMGHALLEGACLWGLALLADAKDDGVGAAERCRAILRKLRGHDERHVAIPLVRWSATCFSMVKDRESLAACADILSESASIFSHPEPLSALAHTMGEIALLDGDNLCAVEQFEHAIALLEEQQLPRERVESQLRASTACEALGGTDAAAAHAREAARRAERLGAQILERRAAQQLRRLGVTLSGALGPRAGRRNEQAGLTARQLEILGGIARGMTDKELARSMSLSPRTVESHVAKAIATLQCRSRAEAVHRASELGLLQKSAQPTLKTP